MKSAFSARAFSLLAAYRFRHPDSDKARSPQSLNLRFEKVENCHGAQAATIVVYRRAQA